MRLQRRSRLLLAIGVVALVGSVAWIRGSAYFRPIRLVEVVPGGLYRGAWQQPWPMRDLIDEHQIRTVIALAHPVAHPIPASERDRVRALGVRWKHIPIIDDLAATEGKSISDQLDEAADWLADRENWPIYFHCHHGINRTSMVQMAWRAKYCGWSLERAASEIERTVGKDAVPRGEDYRRVARFVDEKLTPGLASAAHDRAVR